MPRLKSLTPSFVEYIPDHVDEGVLYISIPFATATHKCCCGCGLQVVTPLSPTDWSVTFNGVSISLDPSIGNWNFPCRSHYWIKRNQVKWARQWSEAQIHENRQRDRRAKNQYFEEHADERETGSRRRKAKEPTGGIRALIRRLIRRY